MAAVAQVDFYTGITPDTDSNVSSVRYKLADNNSADLNNPVQLPTEGETYSWIKHCKLNITTSPSGNISNLRWYVSGSFPTGVKLYVKTSTTYTAAASGNENSQLSGSADASTYTSESPLTINAGTVISNPSTGTGTQDFLVSQLGVTSLANHGLISAITCIYEWEEV